MRCNEATLTAATFRELGPPDLCHVIKSTGSKAAQRDVSASRGLADGSLGLITIGGLPLCHRLS